MRTHKDKVKESLEKFVAKIILKNFEMGFGNNMVKIFQVTESDKIEIPAGLDRTTISKELISIKLLLYSNNKLNTDINLFLKDEKEEIIHRAIMSTWNELAAQSKM